MTGVRVGVGVGVRVRVRVRVRVGVRVRVRVRFRAGSPGPETATVVPPWSGPPRGSSVLARGGGYWTKRVSSAVYCWPLALTWLGLGLG